MREIGVVLTVFCFLAGCAAPRPDFKVAVQGEKEAPPLRVDIKAEQQLPVELKTPIEIEARQGKSLPVEIKTQSALPVEVKTPIEVKIEGDKPLPVEMKVDRRVAIIAVALGMMAVFTFLTAFFTYLATRNIRRAVKQK
jgi:hypothetical protein